jgi:hypothetical protein
MESTPGALQLRLLQTVSDVAAEKNSTLVMPFPVELLRFLERRTDEDRPESTRDRRPGEPQPVDATSREDRTNGNAG